MCLKNFKKKEMVKMKKDFEEKGKEKFEKMEKDIRNQRLFKTLLESLTKSTEQLYESRQKEIDLLQRLLDSEEAITHLITELANAKFLKEVKS